MHVSNILILISFFFLGNLSKIGKWKECQLVDLQSWLWIFQILFIFIHVIFVVCLKMHFSNWIFGSCSFNSRWKQRTTTVTKWNSKKKRKKSNRNIHSNDWFVNDVGMYAVMQRTHELNVNAVGIFAKVLKSKLTANNSEVNW